MASKAKHTFDTERSERAGYRALWSAVALRAFQDVRGEKLLPHDAGREFDLAVDARTWLTTGPGQVICEALGIPAEKVRETLDSV